MRWTFSGGQTISQVWNGTLTTNGNNVTVTNTAYNGTVAASTSTTFGLIANGNTTPAPAFTCTVP